MHSAQNSPPTQDFVTTDAPALAFEVLIFFVFVSFVVFVLAVEPDALFAVRPDQAGVAEQFVAAEARTVAFRLLAVITRHGWAVVRRAKVIRFAAQPRASVTKMIAVENALGRKQRAKCS